MTLPVGYPTYQRHFIWTMLVLRDTEDVLLMAMPFL